MPLNTKQKQKLKKFIKQLDSIRGRHTELVSVYIPADYDLNKIIQHLEQEKSTASNIKDAKTRKNVIDSLERAIRHLRLYKKTPKNGLAVFAGNIAAQEGKVNIKVWSIEPPDPLKTRIYRCDQVFVLDLLKEMLEHKEVYGLIVLDRREATVGLLRGTAILVLTKLTSGVPGKFRAGGQCITIDSLVQLSDGSLPKIKTVHNPDLVKSIMIKNNFSIQDSNIINKWNVKKNKIYKIITKNPRLEIQSSKDHLFFVASSKGIIKKAAAQLKQEDYLIMPEKIKINGKLQKINSKKYYNSFIITKKGKKLLKQKRLEKELFQKQLARKINLTQTTISSYEIGKINASREPLRRLCNELRINFDKFLKKYTKPSLYKNITLPSKVNEEFAQFLGYYLGDGCIETDRITLFEQDKQVALFYQKNFNKFFKTNSSYKFRKNKNYHQLRFTSRPLVRLIKNEFPEIKKTKDSEIPKKILQSKNNVVAAFLRGFFDAEGYVNKKRGVAFGVNNKTLAQQIQLLLLRFSIISSLHEYNNKANKYSNIPRFTVDTTEKKSLGLFKKYIGFSSAKKNRKLDYLINKKSEKSNVRQIIIPGKEIRKIIEKAGYNLQLFPKVNNFFRNERMMSKEVFKNSILKNVKDKRLHNQLKTIYNYLILPVKISKIEKINKNVKMVDISVKNQNFIANGIIVHNSAQRFERLIEGMAKEFYKRIADATNKEFLGKKELKGLLIGGPGPTKEEFLEYLNEELRKKVIAVEDITYTDESGLQDLVEKSQDALAKEIIIREKELVQKFFSLLAKEPEKTAYGREEVRKALKLGAVETLLLSDSLEDDLIEELGEEAEKIGSIVEIISTETREGSQLKDLGGIAAILRFAIS